MRALLIALLLLASASRASAQLDPMRSKAYALRVVLHLAPHRLFTPLFQEQLQSDLRDQLRLSVAGCAASKRGSSGVRAMRFSLGHCTPN